MDLIARARSPELAGYLLFEIDGADLPWTDLGIEAAEDQQINFLVTGRKWLDCKTEALVQTRACTPRPNARSAGQLQFWRRDEHGECIT